MIGVFPADDGGCGNYRMKFPAEALGVEYLQPGYPFGTPAEPRPIPYETIVIQRPMAPGFPSIIRQWQQRGHRVIVDVDDDLTNLHHAHPMRGVDPRPLLEACSLADAVTVSTPALQAIYGGELLRNCIPAWYLELEHEDSTVVGWGGSTRSHPGDLDVIGNGLVLAHRSTTFPFRIVGQADDVRKITGLEPDVTPWRPVELYPDEVVQFGVGLAPLALTKFNAAKSWLKPLEYSALGVPWIGSPTSEYRELNKLGAGMIATSPREWAGMVKRLVADAGLREEMSVIGRAVAAELTVEGNKNLWADVWGVRSLQTVSG